jgi:hypothetical protein
LLFGLLTRWGGSVPFFLEKKPTGTTFVM